MRARFLAALLALAGIGTITSPVYAGTKSLLFNIQLFPAIPPWTNSPDRLSGSVQWSFDDVDPLHTTTVTGLNLIFDGRTFAIADVGVFTDADTDFGPPPGHPDYIAIGGVYDGSQPNSIGGHGDVTDFSLVIRDAFTDPAVLGAAAIFENITTPSGTNIPFFSEPTQPLGAPGPPVGAGLPGLLAGFGALLAWRKRRRARSNFGPGGVTRFFLTIACSAIFIALWPIRPASAVDFSNYFFPSCPVGCDQNSSHAYGVFNGVLYEELSLEVTNFQTFFYQPLPANISPISPSGSLWFFFDSFFTGIVTFDPGNGLPAATQAWSNGSNGGGDTGADWAIDMSIPGVFHPTITLSGSGYNLWKDADNVLLRDGDYTVGPYTFTYTMTVPSVPGPELGAGVPGLLAGFGAMLAWRRRRRLRSCHRDRFTGLIAGVGVSLAWHRRRRAVGV